MLNVLSAVDHLIQSSFLHLPLLAGVLGWCLYRAKNMVFFCRTRRDIRYHPPEENSYPRHGLEIVKAHLRIHPQGSYKTQLHLRLPARSAFDIQAIFPAINIMLEVPFTLMKGE
jgi:hypothetical protein